jgi:hypothetical protein
MADDPKSQKKRVPPLIPPRAEIGDAVLAELADIEKRRGVTSPQFDPKKNWIEHCLEKNLFGVCISGGGIRSATFALGVLQGLREKELLSQADYISTVSGGGYIGSWLQGLAFHDPANYQTVLDPKREPKPSRQDPITFLRKYSNYLAPRNGLSLDALVIPLIWFRNMILNQTIIIAFLMATFIALLAPGALVRRIAVTNVPCVKQIALALLVLAVISATIAVAKIGPNLLRIVKREFDPDPNSVPAMVKEHTGGWIALPLFIAVLLLVGAIAASDSYFTVTTGALSGYVVLFFLVAVLQISGGFRDCYVAQRTNLPDASDLREEVQQTKNNSAEEAARREERAWQRDGRNKIRASLHVIWMSLVTAGFMLLLMLGIWYLMKSWCPQTARGGHMAVAWTPPLFLVALIVGIGLHIGLMGRDFPDASREWLARLAALLVTFIGIWAGLFALSVFAPVGVAKLAVFGKKWVASGTGAWLLSTLMSVLAGNSAKSGSPSNSPQSQQKSSIIDLVARFGPFVAVAGFLVAVAFGTQIILHLVSWNDCVIVFKNFVLKDFVNGYWEAQPFGSTWLFPVVLFFFLVVVFFVLSWRVNINEFSMHHFYKNRLVRCYLGASATGFGDERDTSNSNEQDKTRRMADFFTGFDPKDDIPLYKLRFQEQGDDKTRQRVPYPIVNAALNVTAGTELATQERKALPWFFTPHYSGFFPARSEKDREKIDKTSKPSYADTQLLGTGVALGTAVGISGAAANPNMGYHSSAQTAFLLTLFNVRLGWWMANPTKKDIYTKAGPLVALLWLARELFGFVDESSNYLNLSDGGHFENLGIYELVRRRCRYIIAIDGEADTDYRFESLGGAVRKCRTDFGIEIKIDPKPITPIPPALSRTHCIVGTINYGKNAKGASETGYLLYLKSSITADEPADVEEYRRENPEFPQQPTSDQFFSESQFESYRRLGLHVARTTFDHIQSAHSLQDVFARMKAQWLLPPPVPVGAYTKHGEAYVDMLKTLANSSSKLDLDKVAIGDMPVWAQDDDGRRKFFFYLQLLQLIENVFVDLEFGSAYRWNHPATAGWKQVLEHWADQPQMRDVWEKQKNNYGQPFRDCFNDLVKIPKVKPVPEDEQQ